MKAYKIEMLVIDFEELGEDGIKSELANARFANNCISPQIKTVQVADIGEWSDSHPLNKFATCETEYGRLFAVKTPPQQSHDGANPMTAR